MTTSTTSTFEDLYFGNVSIGNMKAAEVMIVSHVRNVNAATDKNKQIELEVKKAQENIKRLSAHVFSIENDIESEF